MIVHHVRFTLKKGADLRALRRGLKTLLAIPSVAAGWYGGPAQTAVRPVTERGWDQVLVLHFRTLQDHDAYQADPIHLRFIARCSPLWSRVRVVDSAS